jgi:hypothetical protein
MAINFVFVQTAPGLQLNSFLYYDIIELYVDFFTMAVKFKQ